MKGTLYLYVTIVSTQVYETKGQGFLLNKHGKNSHNNTSRTSVFQDEFIWVHFFWGGGRAASKKKTLYINECVL